MLDKEARLARLEIMRQVAKKRQESGAHQRSLERQKSLSFIAHPRMPKSATLREVRDEDLVSDLGGESKVRVDDDLDEVFREYGLKNKPHTTPAQKLEALWNARAALGLKQGQEVDLVKLARPAAVELQISLMAMRTYVNEVMSPTQRVALKKGLRNGEPLPAAAIAEEQSTLAAIAAHKGKHGSRPAASDDDRLLALVRASVELRGGNSAKTITVDQLTAKAAPAMKLVPSSAALFITKKLNKEQRELLGLVAHRSKEE